MGTTRASTPTSSCWRCVPVSGASGRGRRRAVRRDLAGGLVALAAACVRLGFWQIERLHQRRAHNAQVRAARERPPLELTGLGVPGDSACDRRLRSEEHTSELQSLAYLVCRLLLEKKKSLIILVIVI